MGLFRGLLPMIGFIFMVQIFIIEVASQSSLDEYHCQYIEPIYNMSMKVGDSLNCIGAQPTDKTRSQLIKIFEQYRGDISRKNYSNVFLMNYHWVCEYLAVYVINEKLTKTEEIEGPSKLVDQIKKEILDNDDVQGELGSFGTVESLSKYHFYVWNVGITGNQVQFMDDFTDNYAKIMNNNDIYLRSSKIKVMYPATTYFGCALRFDDPESSQSDHLTCVFATMNIDGEYKEGIISEESCNTSTPKGFFDPYKELCIDQNYVDASHDYDVPCQFFYENFHPLTSCNNGTDPGMDEGLKQPPEGYLQVIIHHKNTTIPITYPDELNGSGGPLKLHSISMFVSVLIALMSSICG